MSTKERILEEALALFSEKGYDGTGIDQIAARVGIKGPSIYKHFKGKEDILNALIDIAEARYDDSFGSEKNIGSIPQSTEEFVRITMDKVAFTIQDPMIQKIRKLLVQEQFRNKRLAEITSKHQMSGIIGMYEKIFINMMEAGIMKKDDPEMLAIELTAPAVLMIAKADRQPGCEKEMLEKIEEHVRHFCGAYMSEI